MSEEVKSMYDEIKKKKNHRYLVFYIKDEKTIAVEKIGTIVPPQNDSKFNCFY